MFAGTVVTETKNAKARTMASIFSGMPWVERHTGGGHPQNAFRAAKVVKAVSEDFVSPQSLASNGLSLAVVVERALLQIDRAHLKISIGRKIT